MNDQPPNMRIRRPLWPAAVVVALLVGLVVWILTRSGPLQGETLFDAGPVRIETSPFLVHHDFVLTNVSGATVNIDGARATCGCTEFVPPDSTVEPGESIVIPVSLKLEMSGRKKGGVVLMLSGGNQVNLVMAATVERAYPLSISPNPMDLTGRIVIPYMDLEWPHDGTPPVPRVEATEGLLVEVGRWKLKATANSSNGRPAIWTSKMRITPPDSIGPGSMTIQIGNLEPITAEVIWTKPVPSETPAALGPADPVASPSATADTAPVEVPAG